MLYQHRYKDTIGDCVQDLAKTEDCSIHCTPDHTASQLIIENNLDGQAQFPLVAPCWLLSFQFRQFRSFVNTLL